MRMRAIVVSGLYLLLGILSGFPQTPASRQQQIESHTRQAAEYLKQNRPDLAVPEFKAVLALDPKNANAHGNLGAVLYFQGDYAGATPELRAAVKLQPSLAKTQALLGLAEQRTGNIDTAMHDLENAFPKVQDQKIRIDTGMAMIEMYSASGDLDKAAATVAVLRQLEPTNDAILYSAYRIYSTQADESLLNLSVVAPISGRWHQAMAHELAKRGKTQEAIDNYREALKLDPQLPGLHFELADMLATLGTAEGKHEAEVEYKAALVANPQDEQAECRLGDIATQANDMKLAGEHYSRGLQLQPNDPEANIGMAKVLMSNDEPQKAEALLHRAIELDPANAVAHFRLSTIYRQTGRSAEAKHEVEEYKKYNEMKKKLRAVYHDFHRGQSPEEDDARGPM
jgi:tetratricopeptide (TPR) repeat protein